MKNSATVARYRAIWLNRSLVILMTCAVYTCQDTTVVIIIINMPKAAVKLVAIVHGNGKGAQHRGQHRPSNRGLPVIGKGPSQPVTRRIDLTRWRL